MAEDSGLEETQLRGAPGPSVATSVDAPIYTVGDSHAVAIAQAGGFQNLAVNGAQISAIVSQITSVANGANVILSAGNNNIADRPEVVIATVKNIIQRLNAKNCKVLYVVFPLIDLNGPYSGAYGRYTSNYNNVRNGLAINVISDFNLALRTEEINPNDPMKIHATSAAYTRIANAAVAAFSGVSITDTANAAPDAAVTSATETTPANLNTTQFSGPSPITQQTNNNDNLNPFVYQPIDYFDDRYDFKTGQKIKSGGIPGAYGGGQAPSPTTTPPPPAQTTPETVPGAASTGYNVGQIDPRLAAAAAQAAIPIPGTTGFGIGQIDPRLSAAAGAAAKIKSVSSTARSLPRPQ